MIDYIVIFGIVGVAAFFVGRRLWREAKTGHCADCNCSVKPDASPLPKKQFPV
jgi:hypothetical protein